MSNGFLTSSILILAVQGNSWTLSQFYSKSECLFNLWVFGIIPRDIIYLGRGSKVDLFADLANFYSDTFWGLRHTTNEVFY